MITGELQLQVVIKMITSGVRASGNKKIKTGRLQTVDNNKKKELADSELQVIKK